MARVVIFFVLIAVAYADVANFTLCGDESKCTVSGVGITPCANPSSCVIRKGNDAAISFDFTPNFVAKKLQVAIYWVSPTAGEVPFTDLDSDGCQLTACPTEVGRQQPFLYSLHIGKKIPKGKYPIRIKLWDEDKKDELCCFNTNITIKK